MRLPVTFTESKCNLTVKFADNDLNLKFNFGEIIQVSDLPKYEGDYTIIPKITAQTMKTQDKLMTDNVTIKEIPYFEVSNPQSGKTVIIGGTEIDN